MANHRPTFQAPQFNAGTAQPSPGARPTSRTQRQHGAPATSARSQPGAAMRLSTRDVKMNIAILSAWLDNPTLPKLSRADRFSMCERLDAYYVELRRRGNIAKAVHQAKSQPRGPHGSRGQGRAMPLQAHMH